VKRKRVWECIAAISLVAGLAAAYLPCRMLYELWQERRQEALVFRAAVHTCYVAGLHDYARQGRITSEARTLALPGRELLVSAAIGDVAWTRQLLSRGADPNQTGSTQQHTILGDYVTEGVTPLMIASECSDARMEELLLDNGATADERDTTFGETALMRAVTAGRADAVRVLLEYGADPNVRKKDGCTALWFAPREKGIVEDDVTGDPLPVQRPGCAELLLQYGAEVDSRPGKAYGNPIAASRTALHCAAELGDLETARALVQGGADLNVRDSTGETPLEIARLSSHPEVARMLHDAAVKRAAAAGRRSAGDWSRTVPGRG
jgi:hypothetical protein